MNEQLTIFDFIETETDRQVKALNAIPWARVCYNDNPMQCSPDVNADHVCTSTWKCGRRKDYKTLSTYYEEQTGCRALCDPLSGCTILCEETKAEADEIIKKWKDYYEL